MESDHRHRHSVLLVSGYGTMYCRVSMVICIYGEFEPFMLCMSTAFVLMFSCEKKRRTALNSDLRWRMIWQKEVLGHSYRSIGRHLNVEPSTVCRIVHRFNITSSVAPNSRPEPSSERVIISSTVQLIIFRGCCRQPLYCFHLDFRCVTLV